MGSTTSIELTEIQKAQLKTIAYDALIVQEKKRDQYRKACCMKETKIIFPWFLSIPKQGKRNAIVKIKNIEIDLYIKWKRILLEDYYQTNFQYQLKYAAQLLLKKKKETKKKEEAQKLSPWVLYASRLRPMTPYYTTKNNINKRK